MACQTRPLTPAEAVRQGRKLIAERRRQEAARKAAMQPAAAAQPEPISRPICQPEAAGQGGAEAEAGKPVPEQDQRVEVVLITPVEPSSTPLAAADPMSVLPASSEAAKRDTHPDGTWPLADLRSGQCRFACTADDAPRDQHRFCGRPTRISRSNLHGSWCDEHLTRVWGQGSVSERFAHLVTKDVRRFG